MRRAARVPALLALFGALSHGIASPAAAFPRGPLCAGSVRSSVIWYVFSSDARWNDRPSGGDWTGESYAEVAERGFTRWVGPRNRDGSSMVRMSPTSVMGARKITVVWDSSPIGDSSKYGGFQCAEEQIELNPSIQTFAANKFEDIAAHEMGHALSARHSGRYDSQFFGGDGTPSMATCLYSGDTSAHYTNDDAAVTTHQHAIGANRTLTADYGFENGIRWFTASGAQPVLVSGSTSGGSYHARVLPTASVDNVVQTVTWTMGWDTIVRPSFQYVTPGATDGEITVQLWKRNVVYGDGDAADEDCGYPMSGVDMNTRTPTPSDRLGWTVVKQDSYPITTSWHVGVAQYGYLVPYVSKGAVDLRVRVYSSARNSLGYIHVHYDDVRIQEG